MLFLSETDIQKVIDISEVADALERAYLLYDQKQYIMDQRLQLSDNQNTLLLMPCIADKTMGTKIVSVFPDNEAYPVTQGLMLLLDGETGQIKAILNGTTLTNMRTGAIGGLAIRHLTSPRIRTIGLVGLGIQGLYQLMAACKERRFKRIILLNRFHKKTAAFIEKLKKHIDPEIDIVTEDSQEKLVIESDVTITATTSKDPVLPNDGSLYKGKLVIGIGSFQPAMREFPEALFREASCLFIDTLDALQETGDLIDPIKNQWIGPHQIRPFSHVLSKKATINKQDEKSVLFKSAGMALFDVVAANEIYQRAKKLNIGQKIFL